MEELGQTQTSRRCPHCPKEILLPLQGSGWKSEGMLPALFLKGMP